MRKTFPLIVGHSAYSGANARAYAMSISQAIDILRDRGAKRDDARRAIRQALRGSWASCAVGASGFDVCEVTAPEESQRAYEFHHLLTAKDRDYLRRLAEARRAAGLRVSFYVD